MTTRVKVEVWVHREDHIRDLLQSYGLSIEKTPWDSDCVVWFGLDKDELEVVGNIDRTIEVLLRIRERALKRLAAKGEAASVRIEPVHENPFHLTFRADCPACIATQPEQAKP